MTHVVLDKFKNKLAQQACFGIFSKTIDSNFVEAAGLAGLDFIILDMEHGPITFETVHNHVRAAVLSETLPIVRVEGVNNHAIGSALDAGAFAVQVPNVATAEQAREAVRAAKFHPVGSRGVCRFVKAANYGKMDKDLYFQNANETILILQVEGVQGINNLDSILEIAGFDVLFVGPYDLSQSIGKPGQVDSPEVLAMVKKIALKAKEKGKVLGSFSDSLERNKSLANEGFNFIAYSVDVNIFQEKLKELFGD